MSLVALGEPPGVGSIVVGIWRDDDILVDALVDFSISDTTWTGLGKSFLELTLKVIVISR
mgnify:CR=1 FL=1